MGTRMVGSQVTARKKEAEPLSTRGYRCTARRHACRLASYAGRDGCLQYRILSTPRAGAVSKRMYRRAACATP
jgi:hypothetical protein